MSKVGGEGWIRTTEGLRRQISSALELPRGLDYIIAIAYLFALGGGRLVSAPSPDGGLAQDCPLKRVSLNSPAFPSQISLRRCIQYSLVHLATLVPHQNPQRTICSILQHGASGGNRTPDLRFTKAQLR